MNNNSILPNSSTSVINSESILKDNTVDRVEKVKPSDVLKITDIFGTKDLRETFIGATIIDTDPESGFEEGNCCEASKGSEVDMSPQSALLLYPEMEDINRASDSPNKNDLYMSCCWINGFAPYIGGLCAPENMSQNCINFLKGRGIVTTDQIMKNRADWVRNSLFSCMSWYGSRGVRILEEDTTIPIADKNKSIRKGFISSTWVKNPIEIRYFVKKKNTTEQTSVNIIPSDYIYFLGGSPDVIGDDLSLLPSKITSMYEQIKKLKEEHKKIPKVKKSFDKVNGKTVWHATKENDDSSLFKANNLSKKILRILDGIFLIRNYLVYAKNKLEIDIINEISYDSKNKTHIFTEVNISDIIKKYDTIYTYCKNLCYIFPDIAKADIM